MSLVYACSCCEKTFGRKDHLARHALSHDRAIFRCEWAVCGMIFHRKDVLKRHRQIHLPHYHQKRRRPRRGPVPEVRRPSSIGSSGGRVQPPHAAERECHIASPDNERSSEIGYREQLAFLASTSPSSSDETSSLPSNQSPMSVITQPTLLGIKDPLPRWASTEAYKFSIQHFWLCSLPRFAFLSPSSIPTRPLGHAKAFAMAALGSSGFDEHQSAALEFYAASRHLLQLESNRTTVSCHYGKPKASPSLPTYDLDRFQTVIMLIEYGVWSKHDEIRQWSRNEMTVIVQETVPHLVREAKVLSPATERSSWIAREELIRSLWAFYCMSRKALEFTFPNLDMLSIMKELQLPGSDALFQASTELMWHESINDGVDLEAPDCESALLSLLARNGKGRSRSHESASVCGRQVLLCAIMELIPDALKRPLDSESAAACETQDISHFKLRGEFLDALRAWRSLWWLAPECLWNPKHRSIAELQSMLLLSYLEAYLLGKGALHDQGLDDQTGAIHTATDIFCSISRSGFDKASSSPCTTEWGLSLTPIS